MIVSLILALAIAIPPQQPKTLEPTPLEAFVAQSGARPAGITSFYSSTSGAGILIGGYSLYDRELTDLIATLDTASSLLRDAPR